MNNFIKTLLIILLYLTAQPGFADSGNASVLVRMFDWWNTAMKDPEGFTEAAFRDYYTEDAAIIINGNERVRGIGPMVEHFRGIQASTESVEIMLPFKQEFQSASGNRIFTHHVVRARADGVERLSHIMGYAVIEDGRISLVDFLRYDPPPADEAAALSTVSR